MLSSVLHYLCYVISSSVQYNFFRLTFMTFVSLVYYSSFRLTSYNFVSLVYYIFAALHFTSFASLDYYNFSPWYFKTFVSLFIADLFSLTIYNFCLLFITCLDILDLVSLIYSNSFSPYRGVLINAYLFLHRVPLFFNYCKLFRDSPC